MKENHQAINANPMIPHPCDKIFRVRCWYKSTKKWYDSKKMNLYDAKAEAHRKMHNENCRQDKVQIVCLIDEWELKMKPEWTRTNVEA